MEAYTDVIKDDRFHWWIEGDARNDFNAEELRAYDIITQYIDYGGINFEQNGKYYLKTIKDNSIDAFVFSENKRFDRFDEEMAVRTVECYEQCTQSDRNAFPTYFSGLFGSLDREKFFKRKETVSGLDKLLRLLDDLRVDFEQSGKMIAKTKLEQFVEDVKKA